MFWCAVIAVVLCGPDARREERRGKRGGGKGKEEMGRRTRGMGGEKGEGRRKL